MRQIDNLEKKNLVQRIVAPNDRQRNIIRITDEGLNLKCSTLFNSEKKGLAQNVYNTFCKEYYNLLGVTYKYSLSDVIDQKYIH